MTRHKLSAILTAMTLTVSSGAQPPTGYDANRQPAYQQPPISGSGFDSGRQPVIQGAGVGGGVNVQSFPTQPAVGPIQTQPFSPSYPVLSPYLNLVRGGNTPGSLAINYFNFVQPAQQATGSYLGRVPGQYSYERFGQSPNLPPATEQDFAPTARPAGTAAGFMNTGGYFNRMGTIGGAARQPMRQQSSAPTAGRRY